MPWPPSAQMLTMARLPVGMRRQFLHRLAEDARAGRAERMAERDAAAVGVHALAREGAEVARHMRALVARNVWSCSALMWNSTCAAKASWISQRSMSS